jgi:hypothetical protein
MRLLLAAFTLVATAALAADEKPKDTPAAAKTRKLLKTKIPEVDWKDTRLEDVIDEIKEQVKGLSIRLDTKGGVSRNSTVTYKAKGKTVEEVLDGFMTKPGLGYYVISKKGDAYDGSIWVKQGKERGYPTTKK